MCNKISLFIFILIILFHGYAFSELGQVEDLKEFTVQLNPLAIHEDCFEMEPGDILDYSFVSSKKVNFNIHYHEDSKIFYGIEKNGVISDKGSSILKLKSITV